MPCKHCEAWESKYHELVKEMMGMKREGFVAQHMGEPIMAPELPVLVRKAISDRAKVGTHTWSHLTNLAWDEMRNGTPPETIAADILAGEPPEL